MSLYDGYRCFAADDSSSDPDNGSEDSWGNDGWDDGAASEQENVP